MAQLPVEPNPLTPLAATPSHSGSATIVMHRDTGEAAPMQDAAPPPRVPRETAPFPGNVTTGDAPESEPTIEQYMADLLARTRPFAPKPDPAVTRPVELDSASVKPAPIPTPSETTLPPPPPPPPVPETRGTFSELRELANISARSTFNVHRVQRLILEMHGQRFVMLAAMLATVVLLSLAHGVRSPSYVAAIVAGITACVWSLKYLAWGRELAAFCDMSDRNDVV